MVGTSTRSLVGVTAPRFSRGHHNDRWMVSSARTSWSEAYFPIRAASKEALANPGYLGRATQHRCDLGLCLGARSQCQFFGRYRAWLLRKCRGCEVQDGAWKEVRLVMAEVGDGGGW